MTEDYHRKAGLISGYNRQRRVSIRELEKERTRLLEEQYLLKLEEEVSTIKNDIEKGKNAKNKQLDKIEEEYDDNVTVIIAKY